jgi:hypothetical protein
VLQASLDRDAAALGEVLAADLGLVVEDGDVDVVGVLGGAARSCSQAAASRSASQFGTVGAFRRERVISRPFDEFG